MSCFSWNFIYNPQYNDTENVTLTPSKAVTKWMQDLVKKSTGQPLELDKG